MNSDAKLFVDEVPRHTVHSLSAPKDPGVALLMDSLGCEERGLLMLFDPVECRFARLACPSHSSCTRLPRTLAVTSPCR